MTKKTVTVFVPEECAIKRGSAEWGDVPIDLEAVLALLTEDERASVGAFEPSPTTKPWPMWRAGNPDVRDWSGGPSDKVRVRSASADPEDIVDCVRECWSDARDSKKQQELDDAKALAAWRIDAEKYLSGKTADCPQTSGRLSERDGDEELRERVRAKRSDELLAKQKKSQDEYDARSAREAAALSAREAWAREYGSEDLRFSIENGYPVGCALDREIVRFFCHADLVVTHGWDDAEDRVMPNAGARQCLEMVHHRILEAKGQLPEGCEIECSKIQRVEVNGRKHTGAIVTIKQGDLWEASAACLFDGVE